MHARVDDIECPTVVSTVVVQSAKNGMSRSARTARQNRSGSSIESAWSDAKSSQPRLRASRATFAVSRCRAVGVQVNGSPVIG